MPSAPRIIRSLTEFRRLCHTLAPGDVVLGPMAVKPGEEIKLLDALERGVKFFPSVLAQMLSRSKTAQAEVLGEFMVPGTFVAYGPADLAAQLPAYHGKGQVVTKRDRAHLGLGVSLWPSLEVLCSLAGLQGLPYPLVVQPLLPEGRDLRVLAVGDYWEAYERRNPYNFRQNLFQGGISWPAQLSDDLQAFCQQVMSRGKFPYALLDLLISPGGEFYLLEINLKGGLKGSRLGQAAFRERVRLLTDKWASEPLSQPPI